TFGANPIKLAGYGLASETESLNAAAARLARSAGGEHTVILGAIGPLGVRLEPFGELATSEAEAAFGRQVDGLLAGGMLREMEVTGGMPKVRPWLAARASR
ncbi:MAG: bifunctional homocysteine S-methyltransferase/methylenetetrahydrofolate reductase, partial [Alphaproteobacteria bacterium HGW-Alphaproteobacteria-8]